MNDVWGAWQVVIALMISQLGRERANLKNFSSFGKRTWIPLSLKPQSLTRHAWVTFLNLQKNNDCGVSISEECNGILGNGRWGSIIFSLEEWGTRREFEPREKGQNISPLSRLALPDHRWILLIETALRLAHKPRRKWMTSQFEVIGVIYLWRIVLNFRTNRGICVVNTYQCWRIKPINLILR